MEGHQQVDIELSQTSDATLSIEDERTAAWLYKGDPRRPHKETKGQLGRLESLTVRLGRIDNKAARSTCSRLFKSRERCPLISPLVTLERSISQSNNRSAKRWLAAIMASSDEDSRYDESEQRTRSAEKLLVDIMASSEEDSRDDKSTCLQRSPPQPSLNQIQPVFTLKKVAVEEITEKIFKPVKIDNVAAYSNEHEFHSEEGDMMNEETWKANKTLKPVTIEQWLKKDMVACGSDYEESLEDKQPEIQKKPELSIRAHATMMSEDKEELPQSRSPTIPTCLLRSPLRNQPPVPRERFPVRWPVIGPGHQAISQAQGFEFREQLVNISRLKGEEDPDWFVALLMAQDDQPFNEREESSSEEVGIWQPVCLGVPRNCTYRSQEVHHYPEALNLTMPTTTTRCIRLGGEPKKNFIREEYMHGGRLVPFIHEQAFLNQRVEQDLTAVLNDHYKDTPEDQIPEHIAVSDADNLLGEYMQIVGNQIMKRNEKDLQEAIILDDEEMAFYPAKRLEKNVIKVEIGRRASVSAVMLSKRSPEKAETSAKPKKAFTAVERKQRFLTKKRQTSETEEEAKDRRATEAENRKKQRHRKKRGKEGTLRLM